MNTIADASPLIALYDIGRIELLSGLFNELLIPPAVAREAESVVLPDWVRVTPLTAPIPPTVASRRLGLGETEAIYEDILHAAGES